MPIDLSPQRAFIFRITHIHNVPWVLENGLHCANGARVPSFVTIGNPDLIGKRAARIVPKPRGGTLGDYIPFYFTPKSPTLYNIRTGHGGIQKRENDEIVIIVSAVPTLVSQQISFLFTDRHAYTQFGTFSADAHALETMMDWDILRRHDFHRSDDYPDKMERYPAEALVHRHLPITAILGVVCASEATRQKVENPVRDARLALKVIVRPAWYFR